MREVSPRQFRKAIRKAKKGNRENGWMVDAHDKVDYRHYKCYLSADGKMGVAVGRKAPDPKAGDKSKAGDVVSVFSATSGRNALNLLIPFAIAAGGRKLDCYGAGLQNMYARWGAKPTGHVGFAKQFAPDGWDGRTPDVVAMTLPSSLKAAIKAYNPKATVNIKESLYFRHDSPGKETYAYDKMMSDRDRRLASRERKERMEGRAAKRLPAANTLSKAAIAQ